MEYDLNKHHRRSIRLSGYDYSQPGAYFVTICVHQRECMFGKIVDGQMNLNQYGEIVADTYQWLCQRYLHLYTDKWIIMPNHETQTIRTFNEGILNCFNQKNKKIRRW